MTRPSHLVTAGNRGKRDTQQTPLRKDGGDLFWGAGRPNMFLEIGAKVEFVTVEEATTDPMPRVHVIRFNPTAGLLCSENTVLDINVGQLPPR